MHRDLQRKQEVLKNLQDNINGTIHELKTPLGGTMISMSVIKKLLPPDIPIKLIDNSLISAKHLIKKIDSLLSANSSNSGIVIRKKQTNSQDIDELCSVVFHDINTLYNKQQTVVLSNKINDEDTLMIDLMLLDSIIRNLVENGIKYSEVGVKVDVDIEIKNHQLIVSVSDNGRGIDKMYHKSIFKESYQISKNIESTGFGIGLYQINRIVKAYKGAITVKSALGKGSVFRVTIPCD